MRRTELIRPLLAFGLGYAHPAPALLLELPLEKLEPLLRRLNVELCLPHECLALGRRVGRPQVGGRHLATGGEDLALDDDEALGVEDRAVKLRGVCRRS